VGSAYVPLAEGKFDLTPEYAAVNWLYMMATDKFFGELRNI
jgi:hypothetical protein